MPRVEKQTFRLGSFGLFCLNLLFFFIRYFFIFYLQELTKRDLTFSLHSCMVHTNSAAISSWKSSSKILAGQ
jgi:hypothetical protein